MAVTKQQLADILTDQQVQTAIHSLQEHSLDWANLIVLALGVLVGGASAYYIYTQVRDARKADELERARLKEEFAVRLLNRWRDEQRPETVSVCWLVRKFSPEQCLILNDPQLRPICLKATEEMKLHTQLAFSQKSGDFRVDTLVKDGKIHIEEAYVFHLRFSVISWLDLLESVLTAWRLKVADQVIIKEAFYWMKSDAANLKNYRDAKNKREGFECFPSIAEFVSALEMEATGNTG
jgi:hypothetical protein